MDHDYTVTREALAAILIMTGDALTTRQVTDSPPRTPRLTKLDLAHRLRRMLHAELVHYLRCEASPEVLSIIQQSTETALILICQDDQQLMDDLIFTEPFRHHLYASVVTAALCASEREDIKREMQFWENNPVRIASRA